MMKRRLGKTLGKALEKMGGKGAGKVCATLAAAAMFVSTVGVHTASAGGYGHKYHYGYGHHGYSVGFGYSKYRGYGRHKHGYHGGGRSYAAIIVPTIAIGVGALLYLDHKRKKHGHHHHVYHHHHHQGCQSEYSSCSSVPTAPPVTQRSGSSGSIEERLAGGPNTPRIYSPAPQPTQQRSSTDSPLVASNAPCKPVTQKKRGPDGYMIRYQAMLCYHTNGTAFIQPGSMVPIGP